MFSHWFSSKSQTPSLSYLNDIQSFSDPITAKQRFCAFKLKSEIKKFDKDTLKYTYPNVYNYDLFLEEIKCFDKDTLREVYEKIEVNFLSSLKYELEYRIVNTRITTLGKDPRFSFTQQEYRKAYQDLIKSEWKQTHKSLQKINLLLVVFFGFCGLITSNERNFGLSLGFLLSSVFLITPTYF